MCSHSLKRIGYFCNKIRRVLLFKSDQLLIKEQISKKGLNENGLLTPFRIPAQLEPTYKNLNKSKQMWFVRDKTGERLTLSSVWYSRKWFRSNPQRYEAGNATV